MLLKRNGLGASVFAAFVLMSQGLTDFNFNYYSTSSLTVDSWPEGWQLKSFVVLDRLPQWEPWIQIRLDQLLFSHFQYIFNFFVLF